MTAVNDGYKKLAQAIVSGVTSEEDPQLVLEFGPKTVNGVPSVDGVAKVSGVSATAVAQT